MREKKKMILLVLVLFLLAGGAVVLVCRQSGGKPSAFQPAVPKETPSAPAPAEEEDLFLLYDQSADDTLEVPGRELVAISLLCEMDPAAPEEALKAQAVASYTLFSRMRANRETVPCDPEQWQTWTTQDRLLARFGPETERVLERVQALTDAVYGELLQMDGRPILALTTAISAGTTADDEACLGVDLPYLRPVASPGDLLAPEYQSAAELSLQEFRQRVEAWAPAGETDFSGDPAQWLIVLERDAGGYVSQGLLAGMHCTGETIRQLLGLRSRAFSVDVEGDAFHFTVRGWGTGLGMSLAGACRMAEQGAGYREILAWYYPGTELVCKTGP